jgi:hypothetical protein
MPVVQQLVKFVLRHKSTVRPYREVKRSVGAYVPTEHHHPPPITLVGNLLRPRALRAGANGDFHVKKVEEYLEHASECRILARAASHAHRQQLEDMALTWEQLAEARKREIKKQLKVKYARC